MARLFALILALCAVLPTQAWARVVEVCGEPDLCACRRDDEPQPVAIAQRPDCCATRCTSEVPPTPATPSRSDAIVVAPAIAELAIDRIAPFAGPSDVPHVRPRGPPRRWFGRVRHRLL
jgi:hypothetical protein